VYVIERKWIGGIMQYVFFAAVVGLLGALLIGVTGAIRSAPLPQWVCVILVVLLLTPIPFLLFGFAASFEPGEYHWVWRIAYAILIIGCVATVIRLCWPRRSNPSEGQ
jgi:hypothetical protein